jgi:uncharacterized protein YegL
MEGFEIAKSELADNPSTRCPCILTLDVSSSMGGQPITELNQGIQQFYEEIRTDEVAVYSVEIGIVTFSSDARVITPIRSAEGPVPPTLEAEGSTSLGEGLNLALDILEERKNLYKQTGISYFQPWLILLTDGAPTDEWESAAQRVHQLAGQRKLSFFGIAVGEGANMQTLSEICPPERPPVRLKGVRFRELFEWLSKSMSAVSGSRMGDSIKTPAISGWAEIAT